MKPVHVLAALVLSPLALASAGAQSPNQTTSGLRAKAGDTVLIEGADTVKIVRRQHADIRTVHNPAERWLAVIVDYKTDPAKPGDSQADINYTFQDITDWPLGERWSGSAVVDEYFLAGQGISAGLGLTTSGGYVQILTSTQSTIFQDSSALTMFAKGFGRGGGGGGITMDAAEQQTIAQAQRNAERARATQRTGGPTFRSTLESGVAGGASAGGIVVSSSSSSETMGLAPVRVGSNIRTPQKLHTVAPVRPKAAQDAGIFGMVILEVVVGTDGSVTDTKVLRSIALLDKAAIDAVRQWRYEVTHLNGQPVPVVLTETVTFR